MHDLIFDQPKVEEKNTQIEKIQSDEKINNQEEKKVEDAQKENLRPFVNESIKGTIINTCGLPKSNSKVSDTYVVLTAFSHNDKDHKIDKDFDFPDVRKGDLIKAEVFQTRKVLGDK